MEAAKISPLLSDTHFIGHICN